ncbi:hypothetical protein SLEP1_g39250 [Rubroshorea leprosula]|uniref:Uncharacterized protein n=1 Tax=Rubroshorea leprosula TaxID=152421 RepID=A0AAV5L044_9ROSI|nr:hypothetical protein SLEP1_g39250 [Rubroshorea leprosula]
MASSDQSLLHFVLLPRLAQGHQIPIIDLGRLLAQRGVVVTIITTPINAAKFRTTIDRAVEPGLWINLLEVPFPPSEAGLPERCDSMDALPRKRLLGTASSDPISFRDRRLLNALWMELNSRSGSSKTGEPEKAGIAAKREEVNGAVEQVMAGSEDGEGRRKRARELGHIANKAIEEGNFLADIFTGKRNAESKKARVNQTTWAEC